MKEFIFKKGTFLKLKKTEELKKMKNKHPPALRKNKGKRYYHEHKNCKWRLFEQISSR